MYRPYCGQPEVVASAAICRQDSECQMVYFLPEFARRKCKFRCIHAFFACKQKCAVGSECVIESVKIGVALNAESVRHMKSSFFSLRVVQAGD